MGSWAALRLQPSTGREVFPLGREEGLGTRGDPQALGLPFSAVQGRGNSVAPARARCPHSDCQSPWPSWSSPVPCRNPAPMIAIPKLLFQPLPPSTAQKGCSCTSWAAAQRGQCHCLFAKAPCAKNMLPVKNSLWVYMCWLNKS